MTTTSLIQHLETLRKDQTPNSVEWCLLSQLSMNAEMGFYHDYRSHHAAPKLLLESDIRATMGRCKHNEALLKELESMRHRVIGGVYDDDIYEISPELILSE